MGAELIASLPAASQLFDRAKSILGYDLAEICRDGPADKLDSTLHSQPAMFVTSLAAVEALRRDNADAFTRASATAGLSLGEYTALVFAGALTFEDGLRLVQERGAAMQAAADATPSGMVSILGLDAQDVETLCESARQGETLQVANFLCPGNIVVSGTRDACRRVAELAPGAGAMKAVPLAVAGAFHTTIMQPAVERLRAALANVTIVRPRIPVISNVDARSHHDPDEIRALLLEQLVRPVQWEACMRQLLETGFKEYFEVGPGRVLRGLLRRIDRSATCESVLS
jgi:[acyl-carrier-protein] S-malonyltransferase